MRLNALGRLGMNNPARAWLLRNVVAGRLEAIDETPADRALVVGCGQGADIDVAIDRFGAREVVAIDIDPRQVARARRRTGLRPSVEVRLADVTATGLPDGSFDTVFDLGAVHLVPAWRLAYAEIARLLTPGGLLRFETIVGRAFRAVLPISTEGLRSPNTTGYGEASVLQELAAVGLRAGPASLVRPPRPALLTGLVGDLVGVATKEPA